MIRRIFLPACIALLFIVMFPMTGSAGTSGSSVTWQLVWYDEFGGSAGQSPDAAKWDYDIGTDWGNAQLEYDTDRPANVSLDGNGNLAIIAREESYLGQPYTSARIVTRDLYEPAFGRIEARIKLPVGQGIWPAFWMLGADFESVSWPQCGEIDIMEYLGHEPGTIHGTVHGPGYSGGGGVSQSYTLPTGQFNTDFHVFAVEWEEDQIRWYMDDVLYHTVDPADLDPNEWVFDHPFYIILNLAVGGNWPGSPDGTTVFPQTMLVDYVRVYQDSAFAEECCFLRGDLDASGTVNVSDLTYLVAFLFQGGAAAPCGGNGDVDASGTTNVSDLTYLVARLFQGGVEPPACPAGPQEGPATAAPIPTVDPADVISIFSDVYADVTVDTWSADWDAADVENHVTGSDVMKKYTNLVFAGIEFMSPTINAAAMTHFHLDVWTPDSPANDFRVKLVDFGANGVYDGGGDDVEHELTFGASTMSTGEWVSIDVPLTDFTNLVTREHVAQLIIAGDPDTVYIDNIYFYDAGVASEPTVPAPAPVHPASDVISIFSDVYTDVTVDTWSADWDMADVGDYMIGANNTKKYTNLVFGGIEFATTVVDASAMTHFHIDVWTPDATSAPSVFKIKLVDFGANGVWDGGGDDVEHEITLDENTMSTSNWVSIELALADFTSLTTRGHLAQLIISGDPNTVYVDNVYFHK